MLVMKRVIVGQEVVDLVEHNFVERLVLECEHVRVERHGAGLLEGEHLLGSPGGDGYGVVVLEQRVPHERVQERADEQPAHRARGHNRQHDRQDPRDPRRRCCQVLDRRDRRSRHWKCVRPPCKREPALHL